MSKSNEQPNPTVNKPPPDIEVYFDVRDSGYWYRINGRYVALKKTDLVMHLKMQGLTEIDWVVTPNGTLRQIDWPFYQAMNHRMVDYAGSLAGHRIGMYRDGSGKGYLATDEAQGVYADMPKKVTEPLFFSSFIEELLPDGQAKLFCHWLALGLNSMRKGDFRPGQLVVLCGPSTCGKSFLQQMITQILGGRSANPFRYMMEKTQFNGDLVGSEHWQIEDPASTTDLRTRREFGCKLKEATVNKDVPIHQKGKQQSSLVPIFRRVTLSVNDEPENLSVVPPMDGSIKDKVFLFRCYVVSKAFEPFVLSNEGTELLSGFKNTGEYNRQAAWSAFMGELDTIRAWLLKVFLKVPETLREGADGRRYGLNSWHHPELMEILSSMAPEVRLLSLIDEVCFDKDKTPWIGRSTELERQLKKSDFGFEAEKVLRFIGSCGAYLAKLSKTHPKRVAKRMKDGNAIWTITPQPSDITQE